MVYHTVHYCINIQIIELRIWVIIVWLFMQIITCLMDEILDVVSMNYIQCPIVKMAVIGTIEEHLVICGRRATHGGEMGHIFMPNIMIHIS